MWESVRGSSRRTYSDDMFIILYNYDRKQTNGGFQVLHNARLLILKLVYIKTSVFWIGRSVLLKCISYRFIYCTFIFIALLNLFKTCTNMLFYELSIWPIFIAEVSLNFNSKKIKETINFLLFFISLPTANHFHVVFYCSWKKSYGII